MQLLIFIFLSWAFTFQIPTVEPDEPPQQDSPNYRIALSNISNPNFTPTEEQLAIAAESGVTLFEVASLSKINLFAEKDFSLLFNADIPYSTVQYLHQNRSKIIESVISDFSRLTSQEKAYIAAIGVFRYPADFTAAFFDAATAITDSISSVVNKPLYYHSFNEEVITPRGFSFVAKQISPRKNKVANSSLSSAAVYLEPSGSHRETLNALSGIMKNTRSLSESIIILPADWFFDLYNEHPAIGSVLKNYSDGIFIPMPLPAESSEELQANPGIILLFLIIAGLIIQYKYQPAMTQFTARYFFNHSFFMADILDNRVRSISPGLTFMGIHSAVNGLFFFILFETFFSDRGLNILSQYFAPEFAHNFELYLIFLISTLSGFILHVIAILWLLLLNRQVNSLSKALNLYIWPFTFTLIPLAFLVFNHYTGNFSYVAAAMAIIYVLTWVIAFATASINAARRLEKYRILNLLFTTGLYSLIFASVCAAIVMVPRLFEPIELALKIP